MRKYVMLVPVLFLALTVAQPAGAQGGSKGRAKQGKTTQEKSRKADRDRSNPDDRPVGTAGPIMRYQGLDTNHNGRIERSEWRGDDAGFNNRDWNHDGVLSGDEVKPGTRRPRESVPR